jgi:hypothetical protein
MRHLTASVDADNPVSVPVVQSFLPDPAAINDLDRSKDAIDERQMVRRPTSERMTVAQEAFVVR